MILVVFILLLFVEVECQDDEREKLMRMNYRCVNDQATIMETMLMMKFERQERDDKDEKADINIQSILIKQTELMESIRVMQHKLERQETDMEEMKAEIKEILQNQQKNEWTVIQRRVNGDVSFDRTWEEFKDGFGDLDGSFWIGLEKLYELTKQQRYVLHVDINYFNGSSFYADYNNFRIGTESDGYRLSVSGHSGTAVDGLDWHNGMMFSTKDRDNDNWRGGECADRFKSGWWLNICLASNLNGFYWEYPSKPSIRCNATIWREHNSDIGFEPLKRVQMQIRPF